MNSLEKTATSFDQWLYENANWVHSTIHKSSNEIRKADKYANVVNRQLYELVSGKKLIQILRGICYHFPKETIKTGDCFTRNGTSLSQCFPGTAAVIKNPSRLYKKSYLDPELWSNNPLAAWDNLVTTTVDASIMFGLMFGPRYLGGKKVTKQKSISKTKPKVPIAQKTIKIDSSCSATIYEKFVKIEIGREKLRIDRWVWDELNRWGQVNKDSILAIRKELKYRTQSLGTYKINRPPTVTMLYMQLGRFGKLTNEIRTRLKTSNSVSIGIVGDGEGTLGALLKKKFGDKIEIHQASLYPVLPKNSKALTSQTIADVTSLKNLPWTVDVLIDSSGAATWSKNMVATMEMELNSLTLGGKAFISAGPHVFFRTALSNPDNLSLLRGATLTMPNFELSLTTASLPEMNHVLITALKTGKNKANIKQLIHDLDIKDLPK